MTKYLIRLQPLTPFFFGGENTFGEDNRHYLVRSNYLPQQTTLLGFLRYELLAQNDLLGTNPATHDWNSLIGPMSFQPEHPDFKGDFGAIKSLSPLFLSNGSTHYLPQSLDWTWALHREEDAAGTVKQWKLAAPMEPDFGTTGSAGLDILRNEIPLLKAGGQPFNPKYDLARLWVNAEGTALQLWDHQPEDEYDKNCGAANGFFIKQLQTGIHRKKIKEKTDTGDFFQQELLKLAGNMAFCFYADLDLPAEKTIGNRVVTMGGERSVFKMTVSPADHQGFDNMFTAATFRGLRERQHKAIVLTSDAMADEDITRHCRFAITESIPFRNITTVNRSGNYAKIKGGALQKPASPQYLLKRGSVFFGNDLAGVIKALDKPFYKTIGYNHFTEL